MTSISKTQSDIMSDQASPQVWRLLNTLCAPAGPSLLFLMLAPILIIFFSPYTFSGNEENYFQLAFRTVSPESFSDFSAVFDHSRARILGEWIIGQSIKLFGYESSLILLRVSAALFFSLALSLVFSQMRLSCLDASVVLFLFGASGEQLFGDEWLFKGVETKSFAYIAVLFGFYLALKNRWRMASLLLVLATYFHFLIGGFWVLAFALLAILQKKEVKSILSNFLTYAILVSPVVIILFLDQFGVAAIADSAQSAHLNKIYALRVAHHVAPYLHGYLSPTWFRGIAKASVILLSFLVARAFVTDRVLINFAALILGYLFVALLIAYFDRHTQYLGKLYLFRPSSLILLLSLAIATRTLHVLFDHKFSRLLTAAIAITLAFAIYQVGKHKQVEYSIPKALQNETFLLNAIHENSKSDEIVLLQPFREFAQLYISLHRKIKRPTLVSWKFVPTYPSDMTRWYKLVEIRKQLFAGECEAANSYPAKLLVGFESKALKRVEKCGSLIWQNGENWILKISAK